MTNKILITGGAGFIGSHLCDRFIQEGYDVVCLDNFSSGSRDNITHLVGNPHFTLLEHDVTTPLESKISLLESLTAILHFASPASPNPTAPDSYINHPVETMLANSVGAKNMLDLATTAGCPIIFASTSEVYGDPAVHPQPETYWGNVSSTGVRSCYDEGKRFMEALAFAYYRSRGTKIKIVRIFNTYGPRMRLDDGRFLINLVDSVVHKKPFVLYGDGSATRSFTYIDDLVEGIFRVFQNEKMVGEVVNLGNPGEFTISSAIELAEKISGEKLELVQKPVLPDDPTRRKPDIGKAKSLLGWEPKIDFEAGLSKTIEYYRGK